LARLSGQVESGAAIDTQFQDDFRMSGLRPEQQGQVIGRKEKGPESEGTEEFFPQGRKVSSKYWNIYELIGGPKTS
jgi:hypothetical protein